MTDIISPTQQIRETYAVFGLGRSGLAIAKAVLSMGSEVTIYDEKPADQIPKADLIEEARTAGAKLVLGSPFPNTLSESIVVTNPAIDHRHPALQSLSKSSTQVISEVEFAFRISKAPIIAVTGTNGKSTTVAMITHGLQSAGIDAVLCGNIFGSGLNEQPLTSAADHSTSNQVLIAEVSSFQLEWLTTFKPIVSVITSLSPDHLDRYNSFQSYADTKWQICEFQDSSDLLLLGPEVDLRSIKARILRPHLFASIEDWRAKSRILDFLPAATNAKETLPKVLGNHNLTNLELAFLACEDYLHRFGEPHKLIAVAEALLIFPGISHRLEFVAEYKGVKFINNSMCTNPAAVISSLKAVENSSTKSTHLLVGGVNKDLDFTPLVTYLVSHPQPVYLFGRDASQIKELFDEKAQQNYQVYSTINEAFNAAASVAKDGDIVMLAPGCASMDQFTDFRQRGDVFRSLAKDWSE